MPYLNSVNINAKGFWQYGNSPHKKPSFTDTIFDDNDSLRNSIAMLLNDTQDFTLCGSYSHCLDVIKDIT